MKRRLSRLTRTAGITIVAVATILLVAPTGIAAATPAPPPSTNSVPASVHGGDGVPAGVTADTAIDTCAQVAYKAGFAYNKTVAGYPEIVVAIAIAMAESSCNPNATGVNPGSEDRGLWQINNVYHPEVSNSCAYNAMCNAIAAYRISNQGSNWSPWSTWNNGAWQGHISEAQSAISRLTVTLYNYNTNRCLAADQADHSNGAPVFQWGCISGNVYEEWRVLVVGDNLQVLQNVGTGTCLDADGSAKGNGQPVFQWSCSADTSPYEDWILGGSSYLSPNANATLYSWGDQDCLANDSTNVGDGGKIFQWACDSSNGWEQWT